MHERSLVFVKPENEEIVEDVLDYLDKRLEKEFERLDPVVVSPVPRDIEEHYAQFREATWFECVFLDGFVGKNILLTVYSGEDIIGRIREIVGATDVAKAAPGTIRQVFGDGSLEEAFGKRYHNNVIHASSDRSEAEREIEVWSHYLIEKA